MSDPEEIRHRLAEIERLESEHAKVIDYEKQLLGMALCEELDAGTSTDGLAEKYAMSPASVKRLMKRGRQFVEKPFANLPPTRDRPKGKERAALEFETHPSMPGMVRPIVGRPVAPPEPAEARVWDREPEAPEPSPPEPNSDPTEVDF